MKLHEIVNILTNKGLPKTLIAERTKIEYSRLTVSIQRSKEGRLSDRNEALMTRAVGEAFAVELDTPPPKEDSTVIALLQKQNTLLIQILNELVMLKRTMNDKNIPS